VSSVCVYCETKDIQICISNFHLNFKSKFLFSSKALIILHIHYMGIKRTKNRQYMKKLKNLLVNKKNKKFVGIR